MKLSGMAKKLRVVVRLAGQPVAAQRHAGIPLKQFCYEEAARAGLHPISVWYRIRAGHYPGLRLKRVSRFIIHVLNRPKKYTGRKYVRCACLLFVAFVFFAVNSHAAVLASWTSATGLTCASWDYPLGTRLKVTEIHNHLSVIVTVNDRGPARRLYRQGRKIDLSQSAFEKLDGLALGLAEVTIEKVK